MQYICVRTYGDGKWISMVFPQIFENYHECIEKCMNLQEKLSSESDESDDRWIPFPLYHED